MIKAKVEFHPDAIEKAQAKLAAQRHRLPTKQIRVGLEAEQGAAAAKDYHGNDTGITLIQLAVMHETGAGHLPERSFLRGWYDANIFRMKQELATQIRLGFKDGTVEARCNEMAEKWANELIEWMESGGLAPVDPATEKARERAGLPPQPALVATQQLIQAIRFTVTTA